jgi:hypothetical protein
LGSALPVKSFHHREHLLLLLAEMKRLAKEKEDVAAAATEPSPPTSPREDQATAPSRDSKERLLEVAKLQILARIAHGGAKSQDAASKPQRTGWNRQADPAAQQASQEAAKAEARAEAAAMLKDTKGR